MSNLPLHGLTVIALEQAVAAPFASSRLADAGARVIKIERPEGDFARGYDDAAKGLSSYFVWLNRGKESLVLDLTKQEDKAQFADLLKTADILLQNLKPRSLERLGFPFEELRETHPRLIICSISGYGETGEMADRKAYDLLIPAESGLTSITGSSESPSRVGVSIVDIATGATAHAAILEALIKRGITGKGSDIRISMFDVMADWLTVPLLNHEAGKTPKRLGLAHPSIAPYGVFTTKDNIEILISIQSEREWASFCKVFLENEALLLDERFISNVARVKNRALTDELVAQKFHAVSESEAKAKLIKADCAFANVNDLQGLATHSHLRRIEVDTEKGKVAYPAPAPIIMNEPRLYKKVPKIGEAIDAKL
jgi:itaconate CoA-transferase